MANTNVVSHRYANVEAVEVLNPFYPRWWPERLDKIKEIKKPTGIFLDDMSDWMGDYWPEEWTKMELQVMRDCPQHIFYTLTKQPQNLIKFSPFPDNCYVGVTATGVQMFINAGVYLQGIEAKVKFISAEPLLTWQSGTPGFMATMLQKWGISWLIIGACTGTWVDMANLCMKCPGLTLELQGNKWTAQPKIEDLREIVEAADRVGVKVFLKDNLFSLLAHEQPFVNYRSMLRPEGELRQEFPNEGTSTELAK